MREAKLVISAVSVRKMIITKIRSKKNKKKHYNGEKNRQRIRSKMYKTKLVISAVSVQKMISTL